MQKIRDQGLLQHFYIQAGSASVRYQIASWFRGTGWAPGLLQELGDLPAWLRVGTPLRPPCLPEAFGALNVPSDIRVFVGLAEYFRSISLPQRSRRWGLRPTVCPVHHGGVEGMAPRSLGRDELGALRQLLELGSGSANVTTYLELTQAIVAEAYEALRDEQDAQRNLVEILSGTRYETYQVIRVYHTRCPRVYCYSTYSFLNMLDCYSLRDSVHWGPDSTPFPVRMARTTRPRRGSAPPLYLKVVPDAFREQAAAKVREVTGRGDGLTVEIAATIGMEEGGRRA